MAAKSRQIINTRVARITRSWLADHPLPRPDAEGDKDTRGVVLVVGGAVELPGAVLLAGIGALRAGAGKLQIATCRDVVPQIGTAVPEALVVSLPQSEHGGISANATDEIARCAARVDALLLGPGMVGPDDVNAIVARVLRDVRDPTIVMDASALEHAARMPELTRTHRPHLIFTPHAGEMARMLDIDRTEIAHHPQETVERAAKQFGAIIALKGSVTYVASPDQRTCCYTAGDVGLATSGSGDTLAGVIAGLTARGADPFDATCWGVFLHGAAGNALAKRIGRIGFLARELLGEIPRAMQRATPG